MAPSIKWGSEVHEKILYWLLVNQKVKIDYPELANVLGCKPHALQEHLRLFKKDVQRKGPLGAQGHDGDDDSDAAASVTPKALKKATPKTPKWPKTRTPETSTPSAPPSDFLRSPTADKVARMAKNAATGNESHFDTPRGVKRERISEDSEDDSTSVRKRTARAHEMYPDANDSDGYY